MALGEKKKRFAVVVSGGPAPGINCVISSCVREANHLGYDIVGLRNGFRGISTGEPNSIVELNVQSLHGIYKTGGSMLGTSRFNPLKDEKIFAALIRALKDNNIDKLIVIGGDGSAYLSHNIHMRCPELKIVHVPKTIDNDLYLPNQYPSFGFETALHVGTQVVDVLVKDAETTQRWFLVTSMGRHAGFLALGLGISSAANLTLIPEEFHNSLVTPSDVAGIIIGSIQRRLRAGKPYGVAILAEGIINLLDPHSDPRLSSSPRDEIGRIRYSEIELGDVVLPPLKRMCSEAGLDVKFVTKNIGYELRCHDPIAFDIEYATFLGYGAVNHIVNGLSGVMVIRDFDKVGFVPLADMAREDGTIRSRIVDLNSDYYKVARSFMTQ